MKKSLILRYFSTFCVLFCFSCTGKPDLQSVCFHAYSILLKSADPDPVLISNYNILIYNSFGVLEEKAYVPERSFRASYPARLIRGETYTVLIAANLGYELPEMSMDDVLSYRFHLAYPDEYSHGIPMAAVREITVDNESETILLERLMGRIDVALDRSMLDEDVSFVVSELRIGNCPSSAGLFKPVPDATYFPEGFVKSGNGTYPLERGESVSLYMLENPAADSYLEARISYHSESWHSMAGKYLVYRMKLGPVERNSSYPITLKPRGDGLGDGSDGWRIDRSGLEAHKRFELHPAAYNECRVEDEYHIWCDVLPRGTEVSIEALAYEEDERVADIFDYTVDEDGCGVTIHPRKSGSAVLYFSAGEPLVRDTLAMLVILP